MNIRKASPTVFTPLEDGSAVLLNLQTLFYYNLNRSAAVLWKQIETQDSLDDSELVRGACQRFDFDEARAHSDVQDFLQKLREYRFVE